MRARRTHEQVGETNGLLRLMNAPEAHGDDVHKVFKVHRIKLLSPAVFLF